MLELKANSRPATKSVPVISRFVIVVQRCLREHSPACAVTARIGAVALKP
jgi:hypothetical protein